MLCPECEKSNLTKNVAKQRYKCWECGYEYYLRPRRKTKQEEIIETITKNSKHKQ